MCVCVNERREEEYPPIFFGDIRVNEGGREREEKEEEEEAGLSDTGCLILQNIDWILYPLCLQVTLLETPFYFFH